MRRAVMVLVMTGVVAAAAFVASGWSVAPPTAIEKRLLAQVTTLQVKVTGLPNEDTGTIQVASIENVKKS